MVQISRINIHCSRPNYHTPHLSKFLPLKRLTTNTCSFFQNLIDLTNTWSTMVKSPNVTEMRENIEINNILHSRRHNVWTYKKYWNQFLKITQTLFLIYIHVPPLEQGKHVDLREVLTKKLKLIVYLCFILLKPI